MELTSEQQSVLDGRDGPELADCMKTLVRMGDAFSAPRLVPIVSAHLTGSFKIASFKGYYELLQRIVNAGLKVSVPTTLNPHPGYEYAPQNRVIFRGQKMHEQLLEALGVTPNYSCVCYQYHNIPQFGAILAWAESSAVIYTNSVRIGIGKQQVLTPSGKLHYYLEGTQYGDLNDVLRVCGVID